MISHAVFAVTLLFPQTKASIPDSIPPVVRSADAWIAPDKLKHFAISGFIESVSFASLEALKAGRTPALTGAITLTAAISLAREIHDYRAKNEFSWRDLTWDLGGLLAALVVLRHTEHTGVH